MATASSKLNSGGWPNFGRNMGNQTKQYRKQGNFEVLRQFPLESLHRINRAKSSLSVASGPFTFLIGFAQTWASLGKQRTWWRAGGTAARVVLNSLRAGSGAGCQTITCAALLLLTACAHSYGTGETISNDHGGYVMTYALKALEAKEPRIVGYCGSACTLYLGNPNVCVNKHAVLVFHSAYGAPRQNLRAANAYMLSQYPACIQDYIISHGGLTNRQITMSGKQAMRCVRQCS